MAAFVYSVGSCIAFLPAAIVVPLDVVWVPRIGSALEAVSACCASQAALHKVGTLGIPLRMNSVPYGFLASGFPQLTRYDRRDFYWYPLLTRCAGERCFTRSLCASVVPDATVSLIS